MRWGKRHATATMIGLGVLALAACSDSSASGDGAAGGGGPGGGPTGAAGATTVSVSNVSGVGATLVDQGGRTLYFADQESGGMVRCQDACVRFWIPLTVPAGATPTAGAGVTGTLSVLKRPDSTMQVTLDGKPLYTFTLDGGPGGAKGNGFTDAFDGTTFSWHAATASGAPAAPGPATPGSAAPTGGYGGGYRY